MRSRLLAPLAASHRWLPCSTGCLAAFRGAACSLLGESSLQRLAACRSARGSAVGGAARTPRLDFLEDEGAGEPSSSLGESCLQRLACSVVGVARSACKVAAGSSFGPSVDAGCLRKSPLADIWDLMRRTCTVKSLYRCKSVSLRNNIPTSRLYNRKTVSLRFVCAVEQYVIP